MPAHIICFLGSAWVHIPNGILISLAVFAQLMAERPYALQWATAFPLKIAPSHGGSGLHLIHASLGPLDLASQTASRLVQPFLHSLQQSVPILYRGPSPLFRFNIAPTCGGSGPPSNTWFLRPTWVHTVNGISIGLAVFARLLIVQMDGQIDRPCCSHLEAISHMFVALRCGLKYSLGS